MRHHSSDAASLLAVWREAGVVTPESADAVAFAILADAREDRPPLYLALLAAVGTFLATVFFLAFLGVSGLISFDDEEGMLIWGVVFLAAGIVLSLLLPRVAAGIGRDGMAQTAFTAVALGKVMTVAGIVMMYGLDRPWVPTLAILAVTLASYPVSASSLDRVLSPYMVGASVLFEILGRDRVADPSLALSALFVLATVIAGALLLPHRAAPALRPVGIAALGIMGTIVAIIASGRDAGVWAGLPFDARPIEAVLTLALIGTPAWVAGGLRALARPPLGAACAGIVLLGLMGAPGISFALLVMIVGHALHDMPLRVAGVLALPAFLVLWYYGRDMNFLAKSAVLVGSGALLLAGRAVIARAGWDREDAS